jgi:hypothetical protein
VGKATRHIGTLLDGKEIQTGLLGPATKALLKLKVEGDAININAVPTLVSGYDYSMTVDVSIDGLDTSKGTNFDFYLYNANTRTQLASRTNTNSASFPLTFTNTNTGEGTNLNQNANNIPRMYIMVRWLGDTKVRNTYTIDVIPGDIWTVDAERTDGDLTLTFKQPIVSIGGVSVEGVEYEASINQTEPTKLIVQGVAPNIGDLIVIDKVKYRDVFQSYDFKFTKVY